MRDFGCFIYKMDSKGKLLQNTNVSCWAGLNGTEYRNYYVIQDDKKVKIPAYHKTFNNEFKDYIFISKFIEEDITDAERKRLIFIINTITPCEIVKIEDVDYIKYKLLNNYPSNLVLLNFIRKLWYRPGAFNRDKFFIDIFNDMRGKDSLKFLLTCLRDNVVLNARSSYTYGDHSNVYINIVPKNKSTLFEWKDGSMEKYLKML